MTPNGVVPKARSTGLEVEFTATPARSGTPSNVLHHVSAAELKAADMVKLPLRVITRRLEIVAVVWFWVVFRSGNDFLRSGFILAD